MLGAVQALKSGHPPHSQWAGSGLSTKLSPKKVFSKCLHGLIDNLSLKPGSLGPLMQNENGDRKRGSGVKGLCQAESPSVSCCPHAGWDASSLSPGSRRAGQGWEFSAALHCQSQRLGTEVIILSHQMNKYFAMRVSREM